MNVRLADPAPAEPAPVVAAPQAPLLKCPHCHTVFPTTAPSFPRCPRCAKGVITCRNCRWFDGNFFECTNPVLLRGAATLGENQDRIPVQDPDVLVTCQQHDSRLLVRPRGAAGPTPLWARAVMVATLSGAGALVLLLAFSLWARVPKVNAPPKMSLNMRAQRDVSHGENFLVEFFIRNLEAHESPAVWLRFQQGLFDSVDLVEVQPLPLDIVVRGGAMSSQGRYFKFTPVPGNAETRIRMIFKAKELGTFRSLIRLEVPGASQGQKYLEFDVT